MLQFKLSNNLAHPLWVLFVALAPAANGWAAEESVSQAWARMCRALDYEQLDAATVEKLRLTTCDWVGVVAYTSQLDEVRRYGQVADSGGAEEATELVSGRRVPTAVAASINAFAIHGHEIDDSNLRNQLRASCIAVPAALATAELEDASGRELIVGLAIAYHVSDRLATVMNRQPGGMLHSRGWMPSSVCGTVGAAAAAAWLRDLEVEQIAHAMGLAAAGAGGLFQYYFDGSDEKRLHVARSQTVAAESAALAEAGFVGASHAIEGPAGLLAGFAFEPDRDQLLIGFGAFDGVLHVKPKFYACSQGVIPWLEALVGIRRSNAFRAADVREITIFVPHPADSLYVRKINDFKPPTRVIDAQLSVNTGVALMLLEGDAFLDQFHVERFTAPDVVELAQRVQAISDVARAGQLRVELRDGRMLEGRYPLSRLVEPYVPVVADYRRKFDRLTDRFEAAQRDALWDHAYHFPEAESVAAWCARLSVLLEHDAAQVPATAAGERGR